MKSKLAPAEAGCGDWKVRNWPSGELGAHPATNRRKQTHLDARLNVKKTQAVHAAIQLLKPLITQHEMTYGGQNRVGHAEAIFFANPAAGIGLKIKKREPEPAFIFLVAVGVNQLFIFMCADLCSRLRQFGYTL